VAGIYFTGEDDEVQQWARAKFQHGVRTVPAGSMRFVDFSKPDPAEERLERFMVAAQRAMAEGEYVLAAQRLIYARDAEPKNLAVLRLLTLAFWQADNLDAAARSVREWARVDDRRPAAHRFAARIYEDIGAIDLAAEAAERAAKRGPRDASAWERLGRLRLKLMDSRRALDALERAERLGPSLEGLLDLALARQLAGDLGGEMAACEQATILDPSSMQAWSRYAHALARTERVSECIHACEQALRLGADAEVADLLQRARGLEPRVLPA
jgi:tetratricopeptide (TPR) repeat protein